MQQDDRLNDAIAEATAAFDAGNHAWGRFWVYRLRGHPGGPPVDAGALRAALQEAVLCVPQSPDVEQVAAFAAAIRVAKTEWETLIAQLPAELRDGDLLQAPDAFAEALGYLAPFVSDQRGER